MTLTQKHLNQLVCPVCHSALQLAPESIRCIGCSRVYPIVDSLPRLIADR